MEQSVTRPVGSMVFPRPSFCTGSALGVPDFGGLHPQIGQVQERANMRRLSGAEPRSVSLVFKFAKDKGGKRAALHERVHRYTGIHFRSLLHWALEIGDRHIELYRYPGTSTAAFVAHTRQEQRLDQVTKVLPDYGSTYMTDEEILSIGNHYIACWRMEYQALNNNCQIILIAVCKDCLVEPDDQLRKAWAGYKMVSPINKVLYPFSHFALAIMGCPKDTRHQWDDEVINYQLSYFAMFFSDRFGQYLRLKDEFNTTDDPLNTLAEAWLRRVIYGTQVTQAIFSMYPYVRHRGRNGSQPEFSSSHAISRKWDNRTMAFKIPATAAVSTLLHLRDAAHLVIAHPAMVKQAFERRSYARSEARAARIQATDASTLTTPENDNSISKETFESTYRAFKQVLKSFWAGESTLEDALLALRRALKSGDISWDDVAREIQQDRLRRQAIFPHSPSTPVTTKDKRIRLILNSLVVLMYATMLILSLDVLETSFDVALDMLANKLAS